MSAETTEVLQENITPLHQLVEEHFVEEESLMKKHQYYGYRAHRKEHKLMLKKLNEINNKIHADNWKPKEVRTFVNEWGKHIVYSDMSFNNYMKQNN